MAGISHTPHRGQRIDLTDKVINRWKVFARGGADKHRRALWFCVCECGTFRLVMASSLANDTSKSCGCLNREMSSQKNTRHGQSFAPEYRVWGGMIERTTNPNHISYKNYGGRGIGLSDEFRTFEGFYAALGPRPSSKHTLERKSNSESYSASNCIWATRREQGNNRRNNRLITFNGSTQTLSQWSREIGVHKNTLASRIDKRGWTIEKALTTRMNSKSRRD